MSDGVDDGGGDGSTLPKLTWPAEKQRLRCRRPFPLPLPWAFCRSFASVARWFSFKRKIPIWVNFGGPWAGKCLNILRPFG
jgi:hypothetical protein